MKSQPIRYAGGPFPDWVRLRIALVFFTALGVSIDFAKGENDLLIPVDGEARAASLVSADEEWQLAFDSASGELVLPAAEVVSWGAPVDAGDRPQIVLSNGGVLVADLVRTEQEQILISSALYGELSISLEQVAVVLLEPSVDPIHRRRFLDASRDASATSDRLILVNGDELEGTVTAITPQQIELETRLGAVAVERDRVLAVVFDPSLAAPSKHTDLHAWVGTDDGSRLLASSLLVGGESVRIRLFDGANLETSADSLCWLQPLGGRVVYLSDLAPAGYRHVPYLALEWPYRRDLNVTGAELRSGGRTYIKGLGMHSASRITYELDRPYRRFEALVSIDEGTELRGSVTFYVYVDGERVFSSGVVRGGDDPVPVSVALEGAERVSLVVDFADRGDALDHANWIDARLVR